MSPRQSFTLTVEQISSLGLLWDGEMTPLSPLEAKGGYAEEKTVLNDLLITGVCDNSGSISAGFEDELKVLAMPSSYVSLTLYNDTKDNHISRYYSEKVSGAVTLLEGEEDSYAVGGDLKTTWLMSAYGLDAPVADSQIKPFELHLSLSEAVVFLALCDLERELFIASKIPDYDADEFSRGFKKDAFETVISNLTDMPGFYLFSGMFLIFMGDDVYRTGISEAALKSLADKGFILDSGEGYRLNSACRESVEGFLIPDSALDITHLKITDNEKVVETRISGLVSGDSFHSVMRSSDNPENVSLYWLKRSDAFSLADGILQNPETKPAVYLKGDTLKPEKATLKPAEKKTEVKNDESASENIQKSHAEEKNNNGRKMNFCPECGSPLKEGAKFCSESG